VLASGMKVYPEDIEDALRRFPAVRDCAVVARPDAAGHDQVHAVIIPRDETSGEAGIAEAVRSANRTLGSHQQITGHTLWTAGDFPRTNLGKVKRREVGEVVSAGRRPTEARSTVPAADPGDPVGRARGLLVTVLPEPAPPIQAGSDLVDDLGLDSLGRVELMTVVEQRLGIELDEAQLGSVRTVAELEALLDAGQGAAEPGGLVRWPRTTASGGIRKALQAGLVLPAHGALTTSFEVSGIDRLRKARPPVLLIANHSSHVDTLSIIRALPPELRRKTAIAAASDYFYANPVVGGLSSLVLNTFPFSRAGAVRDSFERCGMLVDQGWSVLVYPEGTRSPTGALLPFKNGIGLLARGLRLPVVPIAVTGGRDILPKNARLPRRAPVSVRFGDPITIDPNRSPGEITAMLEGAVAALLAETKASSRPDVQGRSARDDRSAV
jgi:long-chain acyl-CoA synthetase